jgi:hypothetical protein
MPYIFAVNEPNYRICINNRLFGVPKTERARSQILNVRKGDKLFIYVYGSQRIYGIYKAASDPFLVSEEEAKKGPWNYTATDEKHGYYPYRLFIDVIKDYQQGIPFQKIERLNIGLDRNLLLRKSVIYITDFQANIIEELLKELPVKPVDRFQIKTIEEYESLFTQPVTVGESQEKALQILVQNHLSSLENDLKAVTSYFNIQYGKFKGEIDILARDKNKNFVVTEIKAGNLKRDIWSQLFSYSHVVRNIYAKFEGVDVRSFLVCSGFDIKTIYSYPEIKKLLRREDSLRVFKYQTDFKNKISFEEIPIVIK